MRAACGLGLVLLLLGALPAGAQFRVKAMGDSLTEGERPFDEEDIGGYPTRLRKILRSSGLKGAAVENHGRGGDSSTTALARLSSVLAGDADVFILLIGTNDVDRIRSGQMMFQDTIANIRTILRQAAARGMREIVGTILPRSPRARNDRSNTTTYELVLRIRALAHQQRIELIDFWHGFPNRKDSTYALYYFSGPDPIGHPNAAGFQLMAEIAAGVVLEGDVQSPVEGRFRSPGLVEQVDDDTVYDIELYDFDAGLQQSSATFLINGEDLETQVTGNRRRVRLRADSDGRRACKVVLSVRAEDRAEPPNELDFFVLAYDVKGERLIVGDGNGDCRVDGRDLAQLGPHFGARKIDPAYDEEFDFKKDGVIDGEDLARLANNFGRGSL